MNLSGVYTIILLIFSNIFMTFAWYGHLKMKEYSWFEALPLFGVILFSWGIAFLNIAFRFRQTESDFREMEALSL